MKCLKSYMHFTTGLVAALTENKNNLWEFDLFWDIAYFIFPMQCCLFLCYILKCGKNHVTVAKLAGQVGLPDEK